MNNHAFCRRLLAQTMIEIREITTPEERKKAWSWKSGDQVAFHGPDGHYWHGRGCCRWIARASGWADWQKRVYEHFENVKRDQKEQGVLATGPLTYRSVLLHRLPVARHLASLASARKRDETTFEDLLNS